VALNSLFFADVPLRNYSLTHSAAVGLGLDRLINILVWSLSCWGHDEIKFEIVESTSMLDSLYQVAPKNIPKFA